MPAPARPDRHDYTFASDNTAGMAPEALAALTAANAKAVPSYGDDEWTTRARELIRTVFETDCEIHFVFNGTAANALGLAAACRSYHRVICHEWSHVDMDECGAPEFFTGGAKVLTASGPAGKLTPAGVEGAIRKRTDVHYPKAGALSLTQATEWGTVYSPDEVRALAALAHQHGLAVQMDGARFANAAASLAGRGVCPADVTWRAGVDVLSFGGTKNGMHTTEAVVLFNRDLARDFAFRVKQSAQLASKQRFASAQWVGMLESGAWLRHAAHANAMAQRLARALRALVRARLIVEPEANGVFVELPRPAAEALWTQGWHFYRFIGDNGYRLMCSWATTPEAVDRLAAAIAAAVA
ncbi:MAG TPA: low specificity L-threonine aldolase [Lacunisphaera sp.]|jgi:threonine aldolase|nr:low specificity L-threonine aldolase [Lacunisphaera sp.]